MYEQICHISVLLLISLLNISINQTDMSPDWGLSVQQELCL